MRLRSQATRDAKSRSTGSLLAPTMMVATVIITTVLTSCGAPPPRPLPPRLPETVTEPVFATDSLVALPGNGLMTYAEPAPLGSTAQVQFGVFAGSLFVAPGLAELAARVLTESTDSTTGKPSLRHRIEALGGSLDVQVGLASTWFDMRMRPSQIPRAIKILREALESVTQSRSQIDRMRNELVAERSAQIQSDPIPLAARTLMQAEHGTAAYINGLLDLDPSQVSLFHSRLYRPERCLLTVRAPRRVPQIIEAVTKSPNSIGEWKPPPAVPGPSELIPRAFTPGLYWAEPKGPQGRTRVAIVMQLPDVLTPNAAEWLVMHSCLTLNGTGGRLERFQDEANLPHLRWQTHIEQTPDVTALVMSTLATPNEAVTLWRILNRARASLVEVPPSESEINIALRRATLNAGLLSQDLAARLRIAATLKTRNVPEEALAQRLRMFADRNSWNLTRAATDFQKTPAWMVVVGAGRPDNAPKLRPFELLPEGFAPASSGLNAAAAATSQAPRLRQARAATGGEAAFARLEGFSSVGQTVADQAPTATDTITWNQATGKGAGTLVRERSLLGQTLVTNLSGDSWTETLGTVKKSLVAREAKLLRHEMMRHPLMLLAAHQQGHLEFRPVAQRTSGDRQMMVLEAVGPEYDRLRIHIDTQSHLVRTVESWEQLPDDTLVHVREEWSDYRASGSMRAPYRRRTTWNDGEHQTETVFSEWRAALSTGR